MRLRIESLIGQAGVRVVNTDTGEPIQDVQRAEVVFLPLTPPRLTITVLSDVQIESVGNVFPEVGRV